MAVIRDIHYPSFVDFASDVAKHHGDADGGEGTRASERWQPEISASVANTLTANALDIVADQHGPKHEQHAKDDGELVVVVICGRVVEAVVELVCDDNRHKPQHGLRQAVQPLKVHGDIRVKAGGHTLERILRYGIRRPRVGHAAKGAAARLQQAQRA